jgi:Barrel-sandwich domain of CusB or HlyD membrane-fusion/GAF domain
MSYTVAETQLRISGSAAQERAPSDVFDDSVLWLALAGAQQGSEFCRAWLAIQCRSVGGTVAGLLLLQEGDAYKTAAVWPDAEIDVTYLAKAAEQALKERKGIILDETSNRGSIQNGVHVAYPIEVAGCLHGVVVLDVKAPSRAGLNVTLRQLHWGMGWLETLFRRKQADETAALVSRTSLALDILATASEQRTLEGAALAVANDLATRLICQRVSIGLVKGGGIKLVAISHSAVFQEKSHAVAFLENAMEEALDQNASLVVPEVGASERRITLAHTDLAKQSGSQSVLSVAMVSAGRAVGVITMQRDRGDVFDPRSVALAEAVAVLLGPIFELKGEATRFIAGRAADRTASAWKAVFGPGHPAVKLAVIVGLIAITVLASVTSDLRLSSKAVVEGAIQRAIVAPFDAYIATAPVRAGAVVDEGQLLATLDDRDLKLQAIRWQSELEQQQLKYTDALGKHDRSATAIAEAMMKEAQAQLVLAQDKLARAKLTAPFHAIVVSGDLSQSIGSPIEKGKSLFELAPLDAFRVVLQVDERDIALVKVGQKGQLLLTGLARRSFPFTVTNITPVAASADNQNTFRVDADVDDPERMLSPGMEGIGKITAGRRHVLYVWTRGLINWLRVSIWKWWP